MTRERIHQIKIELYQDALNSERDHRNESLEILDCLDGDFEVSEESAKEFRTLDETTRRGLCALKSGRYLQYGGPKIYPCLTKACRIYKIGIRCGNFQSAFELGRIYFYGYPKVPANWTEAYRLMNIALEHDIYDASYYLGLILYDGEPDEIEQDKERAVLYFLICRSHGTEQYSALAKEKLKEHWKTHPPSIVSKEMRDAIEGLLEKGKPTTTEERPSL